MKSFYFLVLAFATVISLVNATFVFDINALKLNPKAMVSYDSEGAKNSVSEECKKEEENSEYSKKCMQELTLSSYKQVCPDFKSKFCQDFYNDPEPIKYYPECSKNPDYKILLQPNVIQSISKVYAQMCNMDEEGELCPFSKAALINQKNGGSFNNDDDTALQIIDDTCKSKACTESTIEMFKAYNTDLFNSMEDLSYSEGSYSYKEMSSPKKLIEVLESEECQSKQVKKAPANVQTDDDDDESNAITNKINAILLVSLMFMSLMVFH